MIHCIWYLKNCSLWSFGAEDNFCCCYILNKACKFRLFTNFGRWKHTAIRKTLPALVFEMQYVGRIEGVASDTFIDDLEKCSWSIESYFLAKITLIMVQSEKIFWGRSSLKCNDRTAKIWLSLSYINQLLWVCPVWFKRNKELSYILCNKTPGSFPRAGWSAIANLRSDCTLK